MNENPLLNLINGKTENEKDLLTTHNNKNDFIYRLNHMGLNGQSRSQDCPQEGIDKENVMTNITNDVFEKMENETSTEAKVLTE